MNGIYEEVRVALHQIWRRRWLALAVAWGIAILGWLFVAMIPNSYESKSRVYVQLESMLAEQMGVTERAQQADLSRIQQTLASNNVLEAVVGRTELGQRATTPAEIQSIASRLRQRIAVLAEPNNTFEITVTWSGGGFSDAASARLARAVNQGLLDSFVEQNLAGVRTENNQSLRFLDEQIAQRERQLQESSQTRAGFESQFQSLLPGTGSISQRMDFARDELRRVETELLTAESALSAIRSQLAGTPPTVTSPGTFVPSGGGGVGPATAQLQALQSELAQAQGRGWTSSHPDVVALQSQIARLRGAAAAEGSGGGGGRTMPGMTTANPMYMSMQSLFAERRSQVAALTAQRDQLRRAMEQVNRLRETNPGRMAEQERLARDAEVLQAQYNQLLADRDRIRLRSDAAAETDANQFRVIDPPSVPTVPVAPNRPLLLILVLIAAIGGGVGAAFAKSHLQTTYASARRLGGSTGLPVLGAIGEIVGAAEAAVRRQKFRKFAGASAALFGVFAVLMLVEFIQRGMVA